MPVSSAFRVHLTAISKPSFTRIVKAGIREQSSASDVSPIFSLRRNQRPSDRLTVFTQAEATKKSVLAKIKSRVYSNPSKTGEPARAAIVLASPRHASWITEQDFTAELVYALHGKVERGDGFHLLAAVVDGLSPQPHSRELQEGLSIQLGSLDGLLPGLWADTSPEVAVESLARSTADPEPTSSLSVLLPRRPTARDNRISLKLPLANTLFSTGRQSTLLASEWRQATGFSRHCIETVRTAEKRTQVIDLPSSFGFHEVSIRAPLVPITHPRKVLEGLGNIVAKVEVKGEPCPASMELQANISRLLEVRRALPRSRPVSGPIGVWAMVYPKHMFCSTEDMTRFYHIIQARYLGTALGKLAYEMSTDPERLAWENEAALRNALFEGARLRRILGGGGEWGAKASLLSLDPQTSHTPDSETAELDRFIRSFNGENDAKDSIVQQGDFVQFFVGRDSKQLPPEKQNFLRTFSEYPPLRFGCGDLQLRDIDLVDRVVDKRRGIRFPTEKLYFDHFGGWSAEGIYLSSGGLGPNTKVDVPGASVTMTMAKGSDTTYRPYVRLSQARRTREDVLV